jgi:DNA repair protein RecO (recombination protein O)
MDWEAPAVILDLRAYGEGDAVVAVMTAEHGAHRGLARGAQSRARTAVWQVGNLVTVRWVARLAEQLGSMTAELVHPAAALAMDDPLSLAILSSACAVAEGVLPEREPHPRVFDALVGMIARLQQGPDALTEYVRWEVLLLADLGYGLDLSACAVTGATESLAFVSPRTGRAVSGAAAGVWRERLLPLPAFLTSGDSAGPAEWAAGLRLTEHFLARDAFGHHHRPLPAARLMLRDRVERLAQESGD